MNYKGRDITRGATLIEADASGFISLTRMIRLQLLIPYVRCNTPKCLSMNYQQGTFQLLFLSLVMSEFIYSLIQRFML